MGNSLRKLILSHLDEMKLPEKDHNRVVSWLNDPERPPINVLLVGATGSGKSSTVNALLGTSAAEVGVGTDPQTLEIKSFKRERFVFWDTPGLGDSPTNDIHYKKMLCDKLNETDENGHLLIDFVIVIVDGGSRDLGTVSDLIRQTIIPDLRTEKKQRLLIAVNKIDTALSGRHWDYQKHCPDETLSKFLKEKATSVCQRILQDTNWEFETLCLCAGYTDPDTGKQEQSYNTLQLLTKILSMVPRKKRVPASSKTSEHVSSASTATSSYSGGYSDAGDVLEDALTTAAAVATAPIWIPLGIAGGIIDAIDDSCYITTAVCSAFGKPDDCYELTQFRNFRDTWLKQQPDGEALIREYYETAPKIVEAINDSPDRIKVYQMLDDTYLKSCLDFIEKGQNEECKQLYIKMVRDMEKHWLKKI